MITLVLVFSAAVLSAFLSWRFSKPGSRFFVLDKPVERSLHETPTPRLGGVAIMLAVGLCGIPLFLIHPQPAHALWVVAGWLLIIAVSVFDDLYKLSFVVRLIAHIFAAALVMVGGLAPESFAAVPGTQWQWPMTLSVVLTTVFIVWMINLYNFMDGIDGFAGGMAVIGFSAFAMLGLQAGELLFASVSALIASASAGFLLLNFAPAKIFMGDVGSAALGYLAAAMSLWAGRDDIFPLWVAALIFSPFIFDASVTLLRRMKNGERFWEAHNSHFYQRLVHAGWSHRKTALSGYVLMLVCAISAQITPVMTAAEQWVMILLWMIAYAVIMLLIHRRQPVV